MDIKTLGLVKTKKYIFYDSIALNSGLKRQTNLYWQINHQLPEWEAREKKLKEAQKNAFIYISLVSWKEILLSVDVYIDKFQKLAICTTLNVCGPLHVSSIFIKLHI